MFLRPRFRRSTVIKVLLLIPACCFLVVFLVNHNGSAKSLKERINDGSDHQAGGAAGLPDPMQAALFKADAGGNVPNKRAKKRNMPGNKVVSGDTILLSS